jgi:hypothetical protein
MGPPLLMTWSIHRNPKIESSAADTALGTIWAYALNPLLGLAVACLWE